MEMKKIYKSLMTLAAALTLPLMLNAQTATPPKYKYDADKHIGYNKYLLSDTPDENGEYFLRIENFITGNVEAKARPTDFIMVLDVSGSMLYDHKLRGQQVPIAIKKSVNDLKEDSDVSKLRLDDGCDRGYTHYTYAGFFTGGAVGSDNSGTSSGINWLGSNTNSPTHNGTVGVTNRWFLYEGTYYRIFRNTDGSGNRYVYFDLVDDNGNRILVNGQPQRKYLKQDGNDIVVVESIPTGFTTDKKVLLIDNMNNSGYKLYRYANRREALLKGVNTFLDMIEEQNVRDEIWETGITRHQVAVVAFGSCNKNTIPLTPSTGAITGTKVTRGFAVINSDNVNSYKNWDQGLNWNNGTDVGRGVETGRRLFEQLVLDYPDLKPLNSLGALKRNKVMVVFTDGEPNSYSASNSASGYLNTGGHCAYSIAQGNIVKKTGFRDAAANEQEINALIYTINLSNNNTYVPTFLKHLSSDYPQASSSVTTGQNTGANANQFGGTLGEKQGFYMDATEMNDLSEAFGAIASDNTGDMSSTMVSVDQMTSDFVLPFTTTDLTRVKVYTAQCIGLTGDTITDDQGGTHEELAFAEEIPVNERPKLDHLWVYEDDDWKDLTDIYIDTETSFEVSSDSKSITVAGFNYGRLWCGEDLAHNNTRHPVATSDPNYDNQKLGYRGFKIIYEFPIVIDPDALGGSNVPTNTTSSGLWKATNTGTPTDQQVEYPKPNLTVPVRLIIQKTGLQAGESANFTLQRKSRTDASDTYKDYTTFVLTGGTSTPEVRIMNLDPAYYYKVKESNWSWTYENVSSDYYTTDPDDNPAPKNPIVFKNKPIPTPKHAEAKSTNFMRETGAETVAE